MRYQFHEGVQLYIPESLEEYRLVRDRIYDLLLMECPSLTLWETPQKFGSSWITASRILPFTVKGDKLVKSVDHLNDRPDPPFVIEIDIALPVDYEGSPLMTRWIGGDRASSDGITFTKICRAVMGEYQFNPQTLIPTINHLLMQYQHKERMYVRQRNH